MDKQDLTWVWFGLEFLNDVQAVYIHPDFGEIKLTREKFDEADKPVKITLILGAPTELKELTGVKQ